MMAVQFLLYNTGTLKRLLEGWLFLFYQNMIQFGMNDLTILKKNPKHCVLAPNLVQAGYTTCQKVCQTHSLKCSYSIVMINTKGVMAV